ncbi:MAG: hypothetical protein Q9213_003444 [Squamulea squamosa]
MPRLLYLDENDIPGRSSSDSTELWDLNGADFESRGLTTSSYVHRSQQYSSLTFIKNVPLLFRGALRRRGFQARGLRRARRTSRWDLFSRGISFFLLCLIGIIFLLILVTAIFRPSYTRRPTHYNALKEKILASGNSGRGNPGNEKIFIATSIYDKDLLGDKNVFLSIYENDAGEKAEDALKAFKARVPCANEITFERHVSLKNVPNVVLPDGSERTKRIAYLAEMRNRALLPLDKSSDVQYDKLLFLNDVVFDPIDAVQLILSTNTNEHGKSSYLAACAVDFINPIKFYDTFATRDAEGYSMGLPFFPWFSDVGEGTSRRDVMEGKDAVRVKSCWGGMVAFDAYLFQTAAAAQGRQIWLESNASQSTMTIPHVPIRFRAETDLFWEASECCLVHADLLSVNEQEQKLVTDDTGVYINPYIRVAYDTRTLWWLWLTRRIEKLYIVPHYLVNHLVRMPRANPRRKEIRGTKRFLLVNKIPDAGNLGALGMSGSRTPQMALDDAASIKAFLSKISQAVKPHLPSSASAKLDDVVNQVGELQIGREASNNVTNTTATGAVECAPKSTAAGNVTSPQPKPTDTFPAEGASDIIPAEKVSDWIHVHAPPDHSKSKNPLVAAVQAQGSPQVSGVMAPPPTPEAVPNVAIGKLLMDALDEIPQDRMLSLGDSIHAPKNYSKLHSHRSTAASQSQNQFFSPVPQSARPRDDPSFTRMSFKAAETPSAPIFSVPGSRNKPEADFQLAVQGPPSATTLKENARPGKPVDLSTKSIEIDRSRVLMPNASEAVIGAAAINGSNTYIPAAPEMPPPAPSLKPVPAQEVKASQVNTAEIALAAAAIKGHKIRTPDIPDTPEAAPRLKPAPAEKFRPIKVSTPDVPDRPLDINVKGSAEKKTHLQPRYSQVNPFSTDNIPHPTKEVEKVKENKSAGPSVMPRSIANVTASGLAIGTPGELLTPGRGLLTPASMTFGAVSPQSVKAAGVTTASVLGNVVSEDLAESLYFKAWPKQAKIEERATRTGKLFSHGYLKSSVIDLSTAARVRKIMLTGIPTGATPTLVASFVFGGPLERIHVGDSSAFVTFLRGEDAAKYYEATGNGLDYEKDGVKHVIMTDMTSEVNPVSGILREYIEKEFTRCVRAIGVDREWTTMALHETAARKGRKVERIFDGLNASNASTLESTAPQMTLVTRLEVEANTAVLICAAATGLHFD